MKLASDPAEALAPLFRRFNLFVSRVEWKRFVLDQDVLAGALPARAAAARHRASLPEAREREDNFRRASATYVAAIADADGFAEATRRISVDGLTWWVPIRNPGNAADVDKYVRHQDFPYRTIAQTRELAVGGIMLDLGANNGRMSVPRAVLGDAQAIYCAEPDPLNYRCLVRNVRDNGLQGLVMPDCVAIGSANDVVRMVRAKSPGGHRVLEAGASSRRETIEVPSVTLDTWCDRLGVDLQQVSFIKMDVQGSEMHVLRGAERVLACRHIVWQMEIDVALLRSRDFGTDDLFGVLRRYFTHFIDLNRRARGARVRTIEDLPAGLAYLKDDAPRTDVLVFSLSPTL